MAKLLYLRDGKTIIVPTLLATEVPVQYPSDYFVTCKTKPPLTVHAASNELGSCLMNSFIRGTAEVDVAIAFLYNTLRLQPVRNTKAWTSFTHDICAENVDCNISNLFQVTAAREALRLTELSGAYQANKDDKWLLLAALAPYRLVQCGNDEYRGRLVPKIDEKLQALGKLPTIVVALDSFHTKYASWTTNTTYRKLVAGIDMFYSRFRDHELAILRMCTLTSRFKDCAALLGLGYLANILGVTISDVAEWVFVDRMRREFQQLMHPNQEIDLLESFCPYLMDLGLSKKSPYSSSANPNLHTWIHTVGCTFKVDRSKHARMMSDACLTDVITNAQLLSFAFIKATNLVNVIAADPRQGKEEGLYPQGIDADEWFCWIKDQQDNIPAEMIEIIYRNWSSLRETRPGTVGRYLLELSGGEPEA